MNEKKEKIYYSENLKYLIRHSDFKKELISPNKDSNKELKTAYVINKQIIKRFNEIYELEDIFKILGKNGLLNNISYQNYDENYNKFYKCIIENKKGYFNSIQKKEVIGKMRFEERENIFEVKPNLQYIDNFEIIDKDYYTFLRRKFGEKLLMFQTLYANIEDKLFLIINFQNNYFYEIASFNKSDLIVEYSIEVSNEIPEDGNNNKDEILPNNEILKILNEKGIKNIISQTSPVIKEKNIVMKFHPINKNITPNELGNSITNAPNTVLEKKETNTIHIPNNNRTDIVPPAYPIINTNPYNIIPSQTVITPMIPQNQNFTTIQFKGQHNINKGFINHQKTFITHPQYYLIDKGLFLLANNLNQNKLISYGNLPNLDPYNIKIEQIPFSNKVLYFPRNFMIIDNNYLDFYFGAIKNQLHNRLIAEIDFFKFSNFCVFKAKATNYPILNNNLIYIYLTKSIDKTKEPYAIIECKDINDNNNKFRKLRQDPNLRNFINNPNYLSTIFQSHCYLYQDLKNIYQQKASETKLVLAPNKFNTPNKDDIHKAKTTFLQKHNNLNMKDNNSYIINDRLNVLILLAISQLYPTKDKLEKVYLINQKWLDEYDFAEIKKLLNERSKELIGLGNQIRDLPSVSSIIGILDSDKLQQCNSKMKLNSEVTFFAHPIQILLIDKNIDLYNEFVLVNEKIFKDIMKYFEVKQTKKDDIYYIHSKEQMDFIIFKNYQSFNSNTPQNLIFVGNLDKNTNAYNIQHIFDFKDK